VITAIIVFVVSAVVTWHNIGFRFDYVSRWLSAFIVDGRGGGDGVRAIPFARALTLPVVALIDGTA